MTRLVLYNDRGEKEHDIKKAAILVESELDDFWKMNSQF
jgi:hypothetical protein